ncbi:MAG TPA: rhodanese-like domain-containing protein [Chthoniobacterales bacterium]|nr:rhodanese-like domain-containing protein [Chthoniobacterales bacterium]
MIRYIRFTIGAALFFGALASSHGFGWALVNAKIRSEFPNVRRISTAELDAWLNDRSRPAPLLLDVRTRAEFDVSHLEGAKHIKPGAPASIVMESKSRPIVTYCSVGYRSGGFAKQLGDAGFTHVANLEGSIFRWANEGRPLVSDGASAQQVHPYNRTWGLLLHRDRRATVPPVDGKRGASAGSVSNPR